MEEKIGVSIIRIKGIIAKLSNETFTTVEILREYSGGFYSNALTPPSYSFNAQFGRLLKRNAANLHITEIQKNVPISDDSGNKTKTSRWKKIL